MGVRQDGDLGETARGQMGMRPKRGSDPGEGHPPGRTKRARGRVQGGCEGEACLSLSCPLRFQVDPSGPGLACPP